MKAHVRVRVSVTATIGQGPLQGVDDIQDEGRN